MANFTAKWLPLALLIIFIIVLSCCESRNVRHGDRINTSTPNIVEQTNIGDHSLVLLEKLGFDRWTLDKYRRRSLLIGISGADRLVPAGPNSQHNSQPPSG